MRYPPEADSQVATPQDVCREADSQENPALQI